MSDAPDLNVTELNVHADLAYLRSLAQDASPTLRTAGAMVALAGFVFGLSAIRIWMIGIDWITWPQSLLPYLGWDALAVHLVLAFLLLNRLGGLSRRRQRGGAGGSAVSAALSAIGLALTAAMVALSTAAIRLEDPRLVLLVFPIVIFALTGAAWWVTHAVYRRAWALFAAIGCFGAAFTVGWFAGTPTQWLALGLGLICWLTAPGIMLARDAGGAANGIRPSAQGGA